jgi:hypothetical protein
MFVREAWSQTFVIINYLQFANRALGSTKAMDLRLKPQDVVVALKLVASANSSWKQPELAKALHMSASEVNHGLKRLAACHLFNPRERRVVRASLLEFLVSGLRYVFPAQLGLFGEGMPTSVGASVLKGKVRLGEEEMLVWPMADRAKAVRGRVVAPLYKNVPLAAAEDPALHDYLALADALRVGRARERALAKDELTKRLAS